MSTNGREAPCTALRVIGETHVCLHPLLHRADQITHAAYCRERCPRYTTEAIALRSVPEHILPGPGWLSRAAHFGTAVIHWVASGCQFRSQADVDRIAAICRACEFISSDKTTCRHNDCGCNVVDHSIVTKARSAAERCPLGKW